MVDFTSQSITFALNGESLGVAFTSIDSNTMLYPSISCSAHQGCKIRYGYSWDPLEYAPPNYLPVVAAHPPPALMDVSPMSNTLQNEDIMNSGRSSLSINDLSVIFYYEINIQKRVFTDSDIIIGFRDVLGHYEGLVVTRSAFHYRRSHTSMLSKSHEIHSNPDTIMNSIEPVYSGDVIGCVVTMDQIGFYIQGTFWLYDHALTFKKVVPAFTTTNNIIDTELTSTTPVIYPFIHNLQCYHINYGQEPFLHYNNK
ncbi:hypothetical protein BDF22DRAFT_418465 [Syncephalis plumigaleata]|nr:hypothetical protein BDF22DRAFT_418465 [Syncephalis plumigaleata]